MVALLPGVVRIKGKAEYYDSVKTSLLIKYRLSAQAFRGKFRESKRAKDKSYSWFAYKPMANM